MADSKLTDKDKIRIHDEDRSVSVANADRASGSWNSASTNVGDEKFMSELGKEGIKRQQYHMRAKADDVTYDQHRAARQAKTSSKYK